MHKIRTKYLLRMSLFIFFTIGGLTFLYYSFADDIYISDRKKAMNEFYHIISKMNMDNLSEAENLQLEDFHDQGFTITIMNDTDIVFSTYKRQSEENNTKNLIIHNADMYQKDATATVEPDGNTIKLRGKVEKDNTEYYVYLSIKIQTLHNTIAFMSKFLVIELFIVFMIGIPFSLYMANKTIKPIEQISSMTKKMSNNEHIDKEGYRFPDDEIGILANHITDMYNKITSNMNELNNYNYLLKIQNRDLIEFDERRKEFISMATHELKTPLAIISSQLEMLNLDNSEIMSEYYDSMMEEIQKMSNLIRDMLKASFNNKMSKNVELEKENLSILIKGMEDKYTTWLAAKGIVSKFKIEEDVFIRMNKEQIEQAINNYMMNAYEHTEKNGRVEVSLIKTLDKAVISVYNDGDNINHEELDKIWNYFYREKRENIDSNVGLGLYIVKDIVKSHGGICYAKNRPEGVEFVIEFNLAE